MFLFQSMFIVIILFCRNSSYTTKNMIYDIKEEGVGVKPRLYIIYLYVMEWNGKNIKRKILRGLKFYRTAQSLIFIRVKYLGWNLCH